MDEWVNRRLGLKPAQVFWVLEVDGKIYFDSYHSEQSAWNAHGATRKGSVKKIYQREVYGSPSTDPAAALQVLERCAESRTIAVNKDKDGNYAVGVVKQAIIGCEVHDVVEAPTLPLAICRFARALFQPPAKMTKV